MLPDATVWCVRDGTRTAGAGRRGEVAVQVRGNHQCSCARAAVRGCRWGARSDWSGSIQGRARQPTPPACRGGRPGRRRDHGGRQTVSGACVTVGPRSVCSTTQYLSVRLTRRGPGRSSSTGGPQGHRSRTMGHQVDSADVYSRICTAAANESLLMLFSSCSHEPLAESDVVTQPRHRPSKGFGGHRLTSGEPT
jgi:hypothetical protein